MKTFYLDDPDLRLPPNPERSAYVLGSKGRRKYAEWKDRVAMLEYLRGPRSHVPGTLSGDWWRPCVRGADFLLSAPETHWWRGHKKVSAA